MIVAHHREKLINAILFFAANTRYCGKIKLIKLLFLLDFTHFRQTGYSVTGFEYHAWELGPVPYDFYQEWDTLRSDLAAAIDIVPEKVIDYTRELVRPKREFDGSEFTKRELKIMASLAERFKDDKSKPLVNITHAERGPWAKIWDDGRGKNERIPYLLAVEDSDPNKESVLESANLRAGIEAAAIAIRN
jgi:uncharacterized phage-associated protein